VVVNVHEARFRRIYPDERLLRGKACGYSLRNLFYILINQMFGGWLRDSGGLDFYARFARGFWRVLALSFCNDRLAGSIVESGANVTFINSVDWFVKWLKVHAKHDNDSSRVSVLMADLRTFSFLRNFDLVVMPSPMFSSLVTAEEQKMALRNIWNCLVRGGFLVFDLPVPNFRRIVRYAPRWRALFVILGPKKESFKIYWKRKFDLFSQLEELLFKFRFSSKTGRVRERLCKFCFRFFTRFEVEHLLESCGFKVVDVYGDFKGNQLNEESEDMIWIAKKT